MVFFQLNVTGLLFQSFRTASPQTVRKRHFFQRITEDWATIATQSKPFWGHLIFHHNFWLISKKLVIQAYITSYDDYYSVFFSGICPLNSFIGGRQEEQAHLEGWLHGEDYKIGKREPSPPWPWQNLSIKNNIVQVLVWWFRTGVQKDIFYCPSSFGQDEVYSAPPSLL